MSIVQKQKGPCAYTAACTHPGRRFRLPGSNRQFCATHIKLVNVSTEPTLFDAGRTVATVGFRPRRFSWASGGLD